MFSKCLGPNTNLREGEIARLGSSTSLRGRNGSRPIRVLTTPRRRIIRKRMTQYKTLYQSKKGTKVVVYSFFPPEDVIKLKETGGLRLFYKKKSAPPALHEVIIVAKAAKTAKNKKAAEAEVSDDELDELETIDDLEDLDVEDSEDEAEDVDEDDEEDEEPAPKKGKKGKTSTASTKEPRQSQAAKNGKVGTAELAAELGTDSRNLRMVLRKLREKDDSFSPQAESGRYEWDSMKDPQIKKIKKAFADGLDKEIKNESLQKLKDKKAQEKADKDARSKTDKKSGKKGKKGKKGKSLDDVTPGK